MHPTGTHGPKIENFKNHFFQISTKKWKTGYFIFHLWVDIFICGFGIFRKKILQPKPNILTYISSSYDQNSGLKAILSHIGGMVTPIPHILAIFQKSTQKGQK